jgi:hypothetical protein
MRAIHLPSILRAWIELHLSTASATDNRTKLAAFLHRISVAEK